MTISLLIVLQAASSGNYLDCSLDMLVSNFMPPYSLLDFLKQPRGLARKDQVLSRVHSTLKDIADLVPLAPSRLVPIVIQRMPNVFTKEPVSSICSTLFRIHLLSLSKQKICKQESLHMEGKK